MAKIIKDQTRVKNQIALDHAEALFMSGISQKDICERVQVTPATLLSWIESFGWREKRAAKTVTRQELVNRLLSRVDQLTYDIANDENGDAEGGKKKKTALEDKLSKLAKLIKELDKEASVVDFIECFIRFSEWLSLRQQTDNSVTADILKTITRLQDAFINDKLSLK